jgi:hypothetical protein
VGNKITEERLNHIVSEAQFAFWDKVAELLPEIKTGDASPEQVWEQDQLMKKWVKEWIEMNTPKEKGEPRRTFSFQFAKRKP